MAFAVVCKSCQARFLLNDDLLRRKVAGRVVTVRCRQCHATIEVDASDVDPQAVPDAPKPAPPQSVLKAAKPAPSPPRPAAKSTLMGIGAARPGRATELVALSPGLLNLSAPSATPPAPAGQRGFPEPPPPPDTVEDLSLGDWEITETPPLATTDAIPESVDDFIEELPPSLPPPAEELPSSTGTPSLKSLAHHDEHAPKPPSDDFLANMTAAMNDGRSGGGGGQGAPTIDVSTLAIAPVAPTQAPSIDLSHLNVPLTGKQTLPLFGLGNDADPETPVLPRAPPTPPGPVPSLSLGSLSPASLDRPVHAGVAAQGVRERKNVVAPATNSEPPAMAARRRSGLAAPVLLALAVAAGILIWKRNGVHVDAVAQAEQPSPQAGVAPPAPPAATPIEPAATAPLASVAAAPATADEDITFETTPSKPAAASPIVAAAHDNPTPTTAATTAAVEKPARATPVAEAMPEPTKPSVKEAPQAPPPSGEPAGPFDREAAAAALTAGAAQASACRKDGDPSGVASVVITFAPSGRVTSANVSGPPFAGTPTGGCIANALRKAHVPAFEGDRVTVSKTIVVQ